MYNSEVSQNYLLENSFDHASLLTSTGVQANNETVKPQITVTSNARNVVASIYSIIFFSIVLSIFLLSIQKVRANHKLTSTLLQQVPCRNCQYFKENHYLNCAVHPSIVLTEQALNCPDYCAKK